MAIVAVLILIVVGKGLFKFALVLLFGHPLRVALTVSAGLAQVGEFSFILGTVGLSLGLLPVEGFQLIVAGALLSIALNPLLFRLADWLEPRLRDHPAMHRLVGHQAGELAHLELAPGAEGGALRLHAILCGYGQVGRMIARAMDRRGFSYVVITQQRGEVEQLRARGIAALYGDASNPELLREAQVESARVVIVAGDDAHVTHLIVDRARVLNPAVDFVVRTHSDEEVAQLRGLTPKVQAVHGQRELAVQMARYTLRRFGVNAAEAEAVAQGLRGRPAPAVEPPRAPSRWGQLVSRARSRGDRSTRPGSDGTAGGTGAGAG
jgi:CPA2 family monovalent cation:H+ antiporter-2